MSKARCKNQNKLWYVIALFAVAILTLFDQITKYCAVKHLKNHSSQVLIPEVLELRYLENKGMAFGLFSGKIPLFVFIGIIFFVFSIYFFIKIPKTPFYYPVLFIEFVLTAGAAGNFLDRIIHGYVIDFIYVKIIDFPIFNVADIYVVVSCMLLVLLILFKYEDEHFRFLSLKRQKQQHEKE